MSNPEVEHEIQPGSPIHIVAASGIPTGLVTAFLVNENRQSEQAWLHAPQLQSPSNVAGGEVNYLLASANIQNSHDIVYTMELLKIFGLGLAILIGALVLNFIASRLSLTTWYDFVKDPKKADVLSLIWLFIIYPFLLGATSFLALKIKF